MYLSLLLVIVVICGLRHSPMEEGDGCALVRRLSHFAKAPVAQGTNALAQDFGARRSDQTELPEVAQTDLLLLVLLPAGVAAENEVELQEKKKSRK